MPFLAGYLRRHPGALCGGCGASRLASSSMRRGRDRGQLKSRVIRMVMGGDERAVIEAWAKRSSAGLGRRISFRPAALAVLEAHRAAGDHLVLLSASPDLYVPRIGRDLGFERTLCTEIQWPGDRLDGALAHRESPRR